MLFFSKTPLSLVQNVKSKTCNLANFLPLPMQVVQLTQKFINSILTQVFFDLLPRSERDTEDSPCSLTNYPSPHNPPTSVFIPSKAILLTEQNYHNVINQQKHPIGHPSSPTT